MTPQRFPGLDFPRTIRVILSADMMRLGPCWADALFSCLPSATRPTRVPRGNCRGKLQGPRALQTPQVNAPRFSHSRVISRIHNIVWQQKVPEMQR